MFNVLSRLRDPAIFQGSLRKSDYFEGWYFKQVGSGGKRKLAVIPGVSLTGRESHAFVQVFDGYMGETSYASYDLETFVPGKDPFSLKIGENRFSLSGIDLELPELGIRGCLRYSDHTRPKYRWYDRGVMGWYGYVPFMETYHGLLSMDHAVEGVLEIEGQKHVFDGGRGYIEKDWGHSFPSSWIWMQSNGFHTPKTSLMVSVASIPWLGSSFVGHLAVMLVDGKMINMSTYMGGKITSLDKDEQGVALKIETWRNVLEVEAKKGESVVLRSPRRGEMTGRTIESLTSVIDVKLFSKLNHKSLYSGTGRDAGLEIMDEDDELVNRLKLG
jgi:tocopherol cyclase